MKKQNYQERDFNLVAKILLGLSMITTGMAIFNSMLKFGFIEYANVTVASLIIEIVLDVLILIAGFAVFLKHRWGLIALAALFAIRMFATIPLDSTMYSYQLGGNMVHFFRDFGLFAIAMCFKKNGVSGWRLMLASEIQDANSTTEDSIGESVVEQNCIENTPDDMGETPNSIQEEEVLTQNTTKDDEADTIEEQSPIITIPAVDNKEEIGTVETKKANSPRRRIKRSMAALIVLSLMFVGGGIGLVIYVNSQEYPKGIEGFSNKFKYCFSIPNNKLAKTYFEKYRKASNAGLDDLSIEFLAAAWDVKPDEFEVIDRIGSAYLYLAYECTDKSSREMYYQKAERIYLSTLNMATANRKSMQELAKIYVDTEQFDKAKRMAETILFEESNDDLAIDVMCRIAYYKGDWDALVKWGKKGYDLSSDKIYRSDCVYLYAKGLYETGLQSEAMRYYVEAETEAPNNWFHKVFQEIGGIPCTFISAKIQNKRNNGEVINNAGESIKATNACYLSPVLNIKTNRTGTFRFYVRLLKGNKVYADSYDRMWDIYELKWNYIYGQYDTIEFRGEDRSLITLGERSFGNDMPGFFEKGTYRFEIYWEGEILYTKDFNVY